MSKWFVPLLLILSLLFPLGVHAQDPVTFSSMLVEIWPEYDKPSVLVIYQMTLALATAYPAAISVRIPTAVGDPNAIAERQVDGSLYNINYTRQVVGEWSTISFTTTSQFVQLEYYDPGLIKVGSSRHYQFVWSGDYAVNQFTIQVQQPSGATNMRISPSLGAGTVADDTLTYFTQDIGAISAGQNINITIDYQKSNDILSAENLPVQPNSTIPQNPPSNLTFSTWLPWILGILGAGLIFGGIFWFWKTGQRQPALKHRRLHSKTRSSKPNIKSSSSEPGVYCSQCGKRALPGDQFCRFCGTPIQGK